MGTKNLSNNTLTVSEEGPESFVAIRHFDEETGEYWTARELMGVLGYKSWRSFETLVRRAMQSFATSEFGKKYDINDHFGQVHKMVPTGSGAQRGVDDYLLSRYACYLIAQNGDPSKKPIAMAQAYFNIQTLRQEQFDQMTDEERRLYARHQVTNENAQLFDAAKASGVKNYGKFYDAGYLGLYGMRNKEIVKKKGLGKDKLLDRAGATELAANLFRITQTKDKLQNDIDKGKKVGEEAATATHFHVGQKVRETIAEIGGTMPEDLPPEPEHIKRLEQKMNRGELSEGKTTGMLDE